MKLVIIESPLAGDVERNLRYLRAALRHSLLRGEAPFASHGLYPGALDDSIPEERECGMIAGFAWGAKAELCAVYSDLGVSSGMLRGIERAKKLGIEVQQRWLGGEWRCSR